VRAWGLGLNGDQCDPLIPATVGMHLSARCCYDADYPTACRHLCCLVGCRTYTHCQHRCHPCNLQAALFEAHRYLDALPCARQGCDNHLYPRDRKGSGAHIMVSLEMELMKLVGLGGTAVVPLCDKCHNCRGGEIELKDTPALQDRRTPVDQRLLRLLVQDPSWGSGLEALAGAELCS
jgi:hypothetical protein